MHRIPFFGLLVFMSTATYTMDRETIEPNNDLQNMSNELDISVEKLSLMLKRIHENLDEILKERNIIIEVETATKSQLDMFTKK